MLAKLMSYFLLGLIWVLTGVQVPWQGCPPKATHRILGVCLFVPSQAQSVTGANGLLDRVDALRFAAPVFFHSVRWKFGL